MATPYAYKGIRIEVTPPSTVKVFWPDCFLNPVYITTSLDLAMRWVDAYKTGEQWAVDARLTATVG